MRLVDERWEPVEAPMYRCPVCGTELNYCDEVYLAGHDVIGCIECIRSAQAEDCLEL